MTTPRVTIGLPVFNGERFLRESVESVLGQDFGDLELLVADNASTDATLDIVHEFAAADRRVRVLRSDRNRGAAWNYNRLVGEARGELFRWHAHDDVLLPSAVQRCVTALDADPGAVLGIVALIFLLRVLRSREEVDLIRAACRVVAEVLVKGSNYAVVRPRQTYEDLIGQDRTAGW